MVDAPTWGSAYTPPPSSLTSWASPAYTPLPSTGVTVVTDVTDVTVAPELVDGDVLVREAPSGAPPTFHVQIGPFSPVSRALESSRGVHCGRTDALRQKLE